MQHNVQQTESSVTLSACSVCNILGEACCLNLALHSYTPSSTEQERKSKGWTSAPVACRRLGVRGRFAVSSLGRRGARTGLLSELKFTHFIHLKRGQQELESQGLSAHHHSKWSDLCESVIALNPLVFFVFLFAPRSATDARARACVCPRTEQNTHTRTNRISSEENFLSGRLVEWRCLIVVIMESLCHCR